MLFVDFVINDRVAPGGQLHEQLGMPGEMRFDPGLFRPHLNRYGEKVVVIHTGNYIWDDKRKATVPEYKEFAVRDLQRRGIDLPVFNTTTSLRKEQWIEIDRRVVAATRTRLRAAQYLKSRVPYGGFNAMARMTLEYEAASDPGEALVSLDGLAEGRNDRPQNSLRSVPLPIIHADAQMSSRLLAQSRNGGMPLDLTMIEANSRRVAEKVEDITIGIENGVNYGTVSVGPTAHTGESQVYGLLNYPYVATKTDLSNPGSSDPDDTVQDVLEMRSQMYDDGYYGPFVIFHSTDWDAYLDKDYAVGSAAQGLAAPSITLRDRLRRIEGIGDVMRLDRLTPTATNSNPFTMVMVQVTPEVIDFINGMEPTVIQWTEKGGMDIRFKVMTIQQARPKHDFYEHCGILVARA